MLKSNYPKLSKLLYDEDKHEVRFFIVAAIILIIAVPYFIISEINQKEAYKKSKITFGIIQEIEDRHGKGAFHQITFRYRSNHKMIYGMTDENVGHPCIDHRRIGDTIIIEYSLTNDDYARIVNCYWNESLKQKYGFR